MECYQSFQGKMPIKWPFSALVQLFIYGQVDIQVRIQVQIHQHQKHLFKKGQLDAHIIKQETKKINLKHYQKNLRSGGMPMIKK
ncbi:hypothetical protein BUE76_04350 [Cnuella takakiae]|nr:hypothetical protein BUE76_04350 [Cnuella takakiae]